MQRNIAENETRAVVLFDFFFWGGGATCERCNICTINGGEGTSFWNIVRHSFSPFIFVVAEFLREVPIRTYVVSNTTN